MTDTAKTIKAPQHNKNIQVLGTLLKVFAPPKLTEAFSTKKQKPTVMQRLVPKVPVALLGVPILGVLVWAVCNILYGLGWVAMKLGLVVSYVPGVLALGTVIVVSIAVSLGLASAGVLAAYRVGRWTLDHPVRYVVSEVETLVARIRNRYGS